VDFCPSFVVGDVVGDEIECGHWSGGWVVVSRVVVG
jgi:hypothetical protein